MTIECSRVVIVIFLFTHACTWTLMSAVVTLILLESSGTAADEAKLFSVENSMDLICVALKKYAFNLLHILSTH